MFGRMLVRFVMHPFLAIIGGGNMGKAIVTGGVNARLLVPSRVCVAERDETRRARIAALGIKVVANACEALAWLSMSAPNADDGQVLLAIKPQSLSDLSKECEAQSANSSGRVVAHPCEGRVVISILAGVTSERIYRALGGKCRVIRAMPNLPAAIGRGATALCIGAGASDSDAELAEVLFKGVGPLVMRTREELMDAFTALAGSGPAYVFYLAEAMIAAGVKLGFSPEQSTAIARATIAGSGLMLEQTSQLPDELRAAVTSKGGTTQAATGVLDGARVKQTIVEAIEAAELRGRELGTQTS